MKKEVGLMKCNVANVMPPPHVAPLPTESAYPEFGNLIQIDKNKDLLCYILVNGGVGGMF